MAKVLRVGSNRQYVCRPGNGDDRLLPMECDVGGRYGGYPSQHIAIIWVRPILVTRADRLGSLCLGIASVRAQFRGAVTTGHRRALTFRWRNPFTSSGNTSRRNQWLPVPGMAGDNLRRTIYTQLTAPVQIANGILKVLYSAI
jgi:hypothetical protein